VNDAIARMAPRLKAVGFTKKAATFNRNLPDGVTHVVSFQSGRFEAPGPDSLYGRFTVNFGVHVRDDQSKFLTESSCRMRGRIGAFLDPPADPWWAVDDPDAAVAALEPLFESMLAYLDQHSTVEQILARAEGPDRSIWPAWQDDPFYATELSIRVGDHARAQKNFSRLMSYNDIYWKFDRYVKFAEEHGLTVPAEVSSPEGRKRLKREFDKLAFDTPYVPWRG
jgi:hypothetical protein